MTWFRRSVHPEDELSAYVDGELGEPARRAVETHVASCEACSTLLRELQDTKLLLSELPKLEPRRSFTLGPEFARRQVASPAPRRMSFSFAPAVALSVLVALLFVDVVDFSAGGSSDDAFNSAGSTASSRQAEPDAAGGTQALESVKADEDPAAAAGAAESSAPEGATDVSPTEEPGSALGGAADAPADASAAEAGEGDGGTAASALAPPSETPAPAEEPDTFTTESTQDDAEDAPLAAESADDSGTSQTTGGPEDTTHILGTEDSSDGLSTLRMLQIVAAIAFVASLVAVFLPRIAGRRER
jgi:anti-sigma factor RsiW